MDISQMPNGWIVIVWFAIFGACVGSFVNVVCYRLPIIRRLGKYETGEKLNELIVRHGKFTLATPRSTAPCCGSTVKIQHNIPVFGWLLLRGKCASCGSPISWKYPATELLFAVVFAAYVWLEGVWLPGTMSFVMMAAGYCLIMIRADTGQFVRPLIWIYLAVFVIQVVLTALGFSSYDA